MKTLIVTPSRPSLWASFFLAALVVFAPPVTAQNANVAGRTESKSRNSTTNNNRLLDEQIRAVLQRSIAKGDVIGGVVEVGNANGVLYTAAIGNRATHPTTEPATLDTIYDLASLTKCLATATAVMLLVEDGKIALGLPVGEYMPEWKPTKAEKAAEERAVAVSKTLGRAFVPILKTGLEASEKDGHTDKPLQSLMSALTTDSLLLLPDVARNIAWKGSYHRGDVTVCHLLTHTGGLAAGASYKPEIIGTGETFRKFVREDIPAKRIMQPPGSGFIYTDLGFITLGNLVEVVSGKPLDVFCKERIYDPLGMKDTSYRRTANQLDRIAPTEWRGKGTDRQMTRGTVHDGNSENLGRVSGHAGLFSTASDIGIYSRSLLKSIAGQSGGLLSPRTAKVMTSEQSKLTSGFKRGYGWDMQSRYSTPRGDLFEGGFGHTGWTGTSLWILPEEDLYIVILTNRVHPDGTGDAAGLRAQIANVVGTHLGSRGR